MATISLDLDGVVIQNPFSAGVLPRIRNHLRNAPALAGLKTEEADERVNSAIRCEWRARMKRGEFVGAYDWDSIYGQVGRSLGVPEVPDVATLVRECCGENGMIALLPGAREGLEGLREAGYRLAAATNGYLPYQFPVLEALGIAGLFETVLSPDTVGFAKPDARFFSAVPDLIAHVGDTLEHDVLGANRAGVTAVWLASDLPLELRSAPALERTVMPSFSRFLQDTLKRSIYRSFHSDAALEEYLPAFVISGVAELPELAGSLARPDVGTNGA